jgi:hypothetical protein
MASRYKSGRTSLDSTETWEEVLSWRPILQSPSVWLGRFAGGVGYVEGKGRWEYLEE